MTNVERCSITIDTEDFEKAMSVRKDAARCMDSTSRDIRLIVIDDANKLLSIDENCKKFDARKAKHNLKVVMDELKVWYDWLQCEMFKMSLLEGVPNEKLECGEQN